MIRHLSALIESGEFTPLIDRRYPLDRIPEAHRYVETGQKIGNVVIVVRPPAEGMVARFPSIPARRSAVVVCPPSRIRSRRASDNARAACAR
jgi:hypothetical protein